MNKKKHDKQILCKSVCVKFMIKIIKFRSPNYFYKRFKKKKFKFANDLQKKFFGRF